MSTPVLIAIISVSALVFIVLLVVLLRPKKQVATMCGGCRRVMAAGWDKCLFCGWLPPPPVPRLEFRMGPLAGQSFPLHEEVTTVGSVAGNSIVLADPAVSRKHFGIRRVGNNFEFADLGSTNGVYINGHRVPKKVLATGDIMRVGNSEMVFVVG